jgi:uncharacterized glyoxalase superfamily protein PhnB
MKPFKPAHYNSVAPYLLVTGAEANIAFLIEVFNATPLRRSLDNEGRIRHAELRIDDSVIMLAEALPDWPALPSNVHVYVPDVDATYRKALEMGATAVQEPVQKDDEDKRGGFRDSGGTTWWIGTQQS